MNSNRLTISMIVLHDKCYAIGKDNEIIVTSESHRVFVENIVKNSAVIMGKETYKHIYNNFDDSVEIIVVSDDDELHDSDHVHCFDNVDDAMYFAEDLRVSDVHRNSREQLLRNGWYEI
jgi:dihydrofolate reductase